MYENPVLNESFLANVVRIVSAPGLSSVPAYGVGGQKVKMRTGDTEETVCFARVKRNISLLILNFVLCFTAGWIFLAGFSVVVQILLAGALFALMILASKFAFHNPEGAHILAPIFVVFEGLFFGAVARLCFPNMSEILFNLLGISFSALIALMIFTNRTLLASKHHWSNVICGSVISLGIWYLYIISVEYLFRVPMTLPHALEPAILFCAVVALCLAVRSFVDDLDYINYSIKYGAPRFMEWYLPFALMVTVPVWYISCGLKCAISDD